MFIKNTIHRTVMMEVPKDVIKGESKLNRIFTLHRAISPKANIAVE